MAEITTADVTEGCIEGTGIYDEFQKVFASNLQNEYEQNRITGSDYSQVYLGGMQAAMQQAIAFALGRQKADKEAELTAKQTELTASKIITEVVVRDKLRAEIEHINKQIEKTEAEIWVVKAQISDDLSIMDPPTNILGRGLIGRQMKKLDSEVGLLNQKKTTEEAQTRGNILTEGDNSVLGKEILLRQRQADGFLRDAEHKMAKVVADGYSMQFTTLDGVAEPAGVFSSGGADSAISNAKRGAGI